jgi:hypothetical protein
MLAFLHLCNPMSDVAISLRDRQKQMREEAILEAANRLLAEKGYQGMTLQVESELQKGVYTSISGRKRNWSGLH